MDRKFNLNAYADWTRNGRTLRGLLAPIRGRGLKRTNLSDIDDNGLRLLYSFLQHGRIDIRRLRNQEITVLKKWGLIVDRSRLSRRLHFEAPRLGSGRIHAIQSRRVWFSSQVYFSIDHRWVGKKPALDVPLGLRGKGYRVWVGDRETGIVMPYKSDKRLFNALRSLKHGWNSRDFVKDLGLNRKNIFDLGILCEGFERQDESNMTSARIKKLRLALRRQGYLYLPKLISDDHLRALQSYYRELVAQGWVEPRCAQVPLRMRLHDEPIARYIHKQLAAHLSLIIGEPWKASYCYWAKYKAGSELKKHTDRKQCAITISFLVNFSPSVDRKSGWPLRLHLPRKTVSLKLRNGEAVAFAGTKIPHSRPRLGRRRTSTNIFFHFVEKTFRGNLE